MFGFLRRIMPFRTSHHDTAREPEGERATRGPASAGVPAGPGASGPAYRPGPGGRRMRASLHRLLEGSSAKQTPAQPATPAEAAGPVSPLQSKLLKQARSRHAQQRQSPETEGLEYPIAAALHEAEQPHGFERPVGEETGAGQGNPYHPQRALEEVLRANGIEPEQRAVTPDEHASHRPMTSESVGDEPGSRMTGPEPVDENQPVFNAFRTVRVDTVAPGSFPAPQQAEIVLPWVLENSFGNSLQRAIVVELLRDGRLPVRAAGRQELLDEISNITDIITDVIQDVQNAPSIWSAVQARLSSPAGQGEAGIVGPDHANAMPWLVLIRWLPSDALRNRALQLLRGEIPREENEEVLGTIHELAVAATRLLEAQKDVDALRSLYSLAISAGQAIDLEPRAQEPERPGSTINSPRPHRPHQRHPVLPPVNELDMPGNASTRSGSSDGSERFYTPDPGEPPPGSPDTTR